MSTCPAEPEVAELRKERDAAARQAVDAKIQLGQERIAASKQAQEVDVLQRLVGELRKERDALAKTAADQRRRAEADGEAALQSEAHHQRVAAQLRTVEQQRHEARQDAADQRRRAEAAAAELVQYEAKVAAERDRADKAEAALKKSRAARDQVDITVDNLKRELAKAQRDRDWHKERADQQERELAELRQRPAQGAEPELLDLLKPREGESMTTAALRLVGDMIRAEDALRMDLQQQDLLYAPCPLALVPPDGERLRLSLVALRAAGAAPAADPAPIPAVAAEHPGAAPAPVAMPISCGATPFLDSQIERAQRRNRPQALSLLSLIKQEVCRALGASAAPAPVEAPIPAVAPVARIGSVPGVPVVDCGAPDMGPVVLMRVDPRPDLPAAALALRRFEGPEAMDEEDRELAEQEERAVVLGREDAEVRVRPLNRSQDELDKLAEALEWDGGMSDERLEHLQQVYAQAFRLESQRLKTEGQPVPQRRPPQRHQAQQGLPAIMTTVKPRREPCPRCGIKGEVHACCTSCSATATGEEAAIKIFGTRMGGSRLQVECRACRRTHSKERAQRERQERVRAAAPAEVTT